MKICIVAEKPSITRAIAPFARKHWPSDDITFIHVVPYLNIRFRYPHALKWADYPHVSEPQNTVAPLALAPAPMRFMPDGLMLEGLRPEDALPHLRRADLIVCACDPDHTGAVSFDVAMDCLLGAERASMCPSLRISALDDASVEAAFAGMAPFGEVLAASAEYGRVKRYFDWNFNVNSYAVLGAAQRRAGVPDVPLSKYALQLLYGLRNRPPMTDGLVINLMQKWAGTGRYLARAGAAGLRFGSAASRLRILDNLLEAGLVARTEVDGKHAVQVSARGQALMNLLHPDCEDPDLPFRLHAWCEAGAASKPAIDRYIKTFFGKQKRFMA